MDLRLKAPCAIGQTGSPIGQVRVRQAISIYSAGAASSRRFPGRQALEELFEEPIFVDNLFLLSSFLLLDVTSSNGFQPTRY